VITAASLARKTLRTLSAKVAFKVANSAHSLRTLISSMSSDVTLLASANLELWKQYITWYEKVLYSIFGAEKEKGYVYVPSFEVVAVTPAPFFEERPVTQTIEVQGQFGQTTIETGWGTNAQEVQKQAGTGWVTDVH
jgi:hypothetical protein